MQRIAAAVLIILWAASTSFAQDSTDAPECPDTHYPCGNSCCSK